MSGQSARAMGTPMSDPVGQLQRELDELRRQLPETEHRANPSTAGCRHPYCRGGAPGSIVTGTQVRDGLPGAPRPLSAVFRPDLNSIRRGHVRDDLVEIGAGGCLGDSQEGGYGTDLPGDQLTGTLPLEVHAGRSEVLQEHVDLVIEPRTSRHAASLPSSRHGARLLRTAGGGNLAVLGPLSPLAVPLLLKPFVVADLLGHARLDTVRAYTRPTEDDRTKALNLLPADR